LPRRTARATDKAAPLPFDRPARRTRPNREEKAQQTYRNLMHAAVAIVGESGYAATTIAKVAEAAGVAHGTFYNYFADREALFDVLLPFVGLQMTDRITADLTGVGQGLDREVARFRSYCTYLRENPGFYRVLYEAEVFAPKAHDEHIRRLSDGYVRSLKRAMAAGNLRTMSDDELDATVAILLGARAYVAMLYKTSGDIPDSAVEAYANLIRKGLFR